MSHPDKKADLAIYLFQQLILQAPVDKTIVVAGGFSDVTHIESSNPERDTSHLEASHEEAYTMMIFHCVSTETFSIVVASQDTDVAVLLLEHFDKKKVKRIWMKTGKARRDNAFSFTQLWVVLVCTGISFRAWVDFMKLLLLLTCKLYSV